MSNFIDTLKQRIKDAFNAPVVAAPVVAPVTAGAKTYKTNTGQEISVTQAGEKPAVGDSVSSAGAPIPDGTYTLEDGTTITTAAGIISAVVEPVAPVTTDPAMSAPAAPPAQITMESAKSIIEGGFGEAIDQRVANLEIVAKALMQNCLGYELERATREATNAAAIEIYKTQLTNVETKLSAAEAVNTKNNELIALLVEFAEAVKSEPTADPKTINDAQKAKFEKKDAREKRIEKMGEAIKKMKQGEHASVQS